MLARTGSCRVEGEGRMEEDVPCVDHNNEKRQKWLEGTDGEVRSVKMGEVK